MKKQLLLLVMMLLPMVASADVVYYVKIGSIYYNIDTDSKTAEVTTSNNSIKYSGSVVIPEKFKLDGVEYSVTSIRWGAFDSCTGLTSITIGNSVTSIGKGAFFDCWGLTSVTLGNSVTSIGTQAFGYCSGLTSITIPHSVTSIGGGAFSGCTSLTSITIPNSVTSIGESAFYECSSLTSVTIPNSVTSIGNWAFAGCSGLTSVTIPNSVTSIGSSAFQGCSSLTSVTIPNSVISIGGYAFAGCSGLTSVTIPNSVISIYAYAFYECSGLTTIIIGSGINTIYSQAFANCAELTDVYCYAMTVPRTADNYGDSWNDIFENSYIEYATLHVPDASINAYSQAEPWKNFKTIIGLDGTPPVEPEKCATPTIQIVDGKLKLFCETEGVTFVTSYTSDGLSDSTLDDEIVLAGTTTCHISVYATKEGYENSDVATADVELHIGKKGDVNADGEVNVGDIVTTTNIMAGKDE